MSSLTTIRCDIASIPLPFIAQIRLIGHEQVCIRFSPALTPAIRWQKRALMTGNEPQHDNRPLCEGTFAETTARGFAHLHGFVSLAVFPIPLFCYKRATEKTQLPNIHPLFLPNEFFDPLGVKYLDKINAILFGLQ